AGGARRGAAVTAGGGRRPGWAPGAPRAPRWARRVGPPAPAGVGRRAVPRAPAFLGGGPARHELRIQRCGGCGTLRHPPGPMCPVCGFARPRYDVAAGTGEVYSYVVHHHPPVPGRRLPNVTAPVPPTRGRRLVGGLLGHRPARVRIGLPVRVTFAEADEELTLPAWREDRR